MNRASAGFSLVELSIVLMIIGIIGAGALSAFSSISTQTRIKTDKEQLELISTAINNYVDLQGHLPCPSSFTAKLGEREFASPTDCTDVKVKVGHCAKDEGFCIQAGREQAAGTEKGTAKLKKETMRVRIGAVPARALNIPFKTIQNQFGDYITYAVTETLTHSRASYENNDGGIDIVDIGDHSVLTPQATAAYVLVNHGQDRVGARVYDSGALYQSCEDTESLDRKNCNFYPKMKKEDKGAVFKVASYAPTGDEHNYDDILFYQTKLRRLVNGVVACGDLPICTEKNMADIAVCQVRGGSNNMPICVQRQDVQGGTDLKNPYNHDITTWKDACEWGNGWQKPTLQELRVLYAHADEIGGFVRNSFYLSRSSFNPALVGNDDKKLEIWVKEFDAFGNEGREKTINISPGGRNELGRIRCVRR